MRQGSATDLELTGERLRWSRAARRASARRSWQPSGRPARPSSPLPGRGPTDRSCGGRFIAAERLGTADGCAMVARGRSANVWRHRHPGAVCRTPRRPPAGSPASMTANGTGPGPESARGGPLFDRAPTALDDRPGLWRDHPRHVDPAAVAPAPTPRLPTPRRRRPCRTTARPCPRRSARRACASCVSRPAGSDRRRGRPGRGDRAPGPDRLRRRRNGDGTRSAGFRSAAPARPKEVADLVAFSPHPAPPSHHRHRYVIDGGTVRRPPSAGTLVGRVDARSREVRR